MKVLVLGYSVTAEQPGFVGIAKEELERSHNAELVKVGLGGLQPYHARYLFPQIIAEHAPDILILDQATPAFRKGGYMYDFSRHGYNSPMLAIPQGETVSIVLPKQAAVTGMIVGIGPKTGMMVFQMGAVQQALQCYDRHAYYHRVGGRSLRKSIVDRFLVAQSAKLPDVELLKGTRDTGARIGGITHILYEE